MKLHFRKIGEGNPVIILHGLFGSSDNWQTFGKHLASHGYMVYMVDLRNHGLSPHDENFNYEVLAADINEFFEDQHLNKAVVMGHSLGGKTAMTFAFDHPDKIHGLIIVDIAPRQYPVQHQNILDALSAIDTSALTSRKDAEIQLRQHLSEEGVIQFLVKNLYWKQKDQLEWRFNLEAIQKNIISVGDKTIPATMFIKPTIFIKGEKANYIGYEDEKEIFDMFKNVEVKTAPGAGHWVHAENPGWLLENVLLFIKNIGD